jgi:transcriptional regulator with XRE-family HTH domain
MMHVKDGKLVEIGKLCADRRVELGLTQREVGEMVGATKKGVNHFEHGDTRNVFYLLTYLSLGVDVDEVLSIWNSD